MRISRGTEHHLMCQFIAILHEGCRKGTKVPQALRKLFAACLQSLSKPAALFDKGFPVYWRGLGLDTFCEALNRDARKLRVRAARDAGESRLRKTGASKRRQCSKVMRKVIVIVLHAEQLHWPRRLLFSVPRARDAQNAR